MVDSLRGRVSASGIIACLALVLAVGGSAALAKGGGGLTAKQKKEVEKIAKKYAGPPGAPGVAGPAGPAGPPGPAGSAGSKGDQGIQGVQGEIGPEGSPWTAGGTLPGGKTETGSWMFHNAEEHLGAAVELAFPIPLVSPLNGEHVHYLSAIEIELATEEELGGGVGELCEGKTGTELEECEEEAEELFFTICSGTAANPSAASGHLCVYEGYAGTPIKREVFGVENPIVGDPSKPPVGFTVPAGAATAGAVLDLLLYEGVVYGTWAVTG